MSTDAAPHWQRDDVRVVRNRDFGSNSYLLRSGDGPHCVVIDPGLDRPHLEQALAASGWQPAAVVCTHGHFDHVGGAAWLQARHRVPVYLHAADFRLARMSNFLMAAFKLGQRITLPDFEPLPGDGTVLDVRGLQLKSHALPGHTPGSVGIEVADLLLSGDSVYARRTALSQMPGEDHAVLRSSLRALFSWVGGGVRVLPGHGPSATVDEIHAHNHELRAFLAQGSVACQPG